MARKKKSLPRKKTKHHAKRTLGNKRILKKKPGFSRVFFGKTELISKKRLEFSDEEFCEKNKKFIRCKDLSDNELVAVTRKKDSAAYKELFLRYNKKLFTYIFHLVGNKDETEDILQNVFSKTYKNIGNFDISRKFSSWLYRIAHNETVNFLKRRNQRRSVSWDEISANKDRLDTATNDEPLEDRWAKQEISREIDEALNKIPEKYRHILKLRYFQELSYEDISKILGKPVNTVGTLINRAKKKLLEAVKKQSIGK